MEGLGVLTCNHVVIKDRASLPINTNAMSENDIITGDMYKCFIEGATLLSLVDPVYDTGR